MRLGRRAARDVHRRTGGSAADETHAAADHRAGHDPQQPDDGLVLQTGHREDTALVDVVEAFGHEAASGPAT